MSLYVLIIVLANVDGPILEINITSYIVHHY
jgi:hypothetical protein